MLAKAARAKGRASVLPKHSTAARTSLHHRRRNQNYWGAIIRLRLRGGYESESTNETRAYADSKWISVQY
jgi:hypothetical protein